MTTEVTTTSVATITNTTTLGVTTNSSGKATTSTTKIVPKMTNVTKTQPITAKSKKFYISMKNFNNFYYSSRKDNRKHNEEDYQKNDQEAW